MRVRYMSDLHLEFGPLKAVPGGDVLVLAGDITVQHTHWDWIAEVAQRSGHLLYVFGNHEFYRKGAKRWDMDRLIAEARDFFGGTNVHVLENEEIEIEGIQFVGCTLWSDFDRADPLSLYAASQQMNDFRLIKVKSGDRYGRLTPLLALARHRRSVQFLERTIRPGAVVVTHHAPSQRSVDPRVKGDILNGCYVSDLHRLVEDRRPAVWLHGHIHCSHDYRIGETRVLCNPRGYLDIEENPDFDIGRCFEI